MQLFFFLQDISLLRPERTRSYLYFLMCKVELQVSSENVGATVLIRHCRKKDILVIMIAGS